MNPRRPARGRERHAAGGRLRPGQPIADAADIFRVLLPTVLTEAFGSGRSGFRRTHRFWRRRRSWASIALTMLLFACTDLLHEPASSPGTALVLRFAASTDSGPVGTRSSVAASAAAGDSTASTGAANATHLDDGTRGGLPRGSDNEDSVRALAEIFAEIDEVRVRVLRGETVVRDTTVQLPPEGGDTRIGIELELREDAETLGVAVELLIDGEPAYLDDVLVSVDAGDTTEVEVDPKPIPAEVRIDREIELELGGIGESLQLAGEVLAVTGEPVEGLELTWETLDPEVVSVTPGGLVTALEEGVARVVGSHGAFSDTVEVSVRRLVEVMVVVVDPEEATLVEGETQQFSATLLDREGSPVPGRSVTWSSSAETVATVDDDGLVRAVSRGEARITAESGGVSDQAEVTVVAEQYRLTVETGGNGTGDVASEPAGISCGDDCTETYDDGTRVVLTATPATGSSFEAWSNCPDASGSSCTVTMTAALTVTATFISNSYALTVERNGAGTVTSEPAGISCGDDCDEAYEHGTRVVLTATPATEAAFDSWTNCPNASGSACTVEMTAARTVTATFAANHYVLTVERNGNGAGTVTSEPAGISCGDDCDEAYEHGTRVVLTATPATGSTFSSWRDCPDAVRDTCTVTVTGAHTVTANFAVARHTLTVEVTGAGRGVVVSDPEGIACPDDCSETYDHGSVVELAALPTQGSTFASWNGCPSPVRNICTVELTAARTVTARFNGPSALSISHPVHEADYTYDGFDSELRLWYTDFTFRGTALDPEDGRLTGESLVWTTDNPVQQSLLGTGEAPEVRLYSSKLLRHQPSNHPDRDE